MPLPCATIVYKSEWLSIEVTSSSDRVLRPMIVAKQLDLPDGLTGDYVSQQTPRTNLTKELEKYNRPMDYASSSSSSSSAVRVSNVKKEVLHMPERPNILSKRPHHLKPPQSRYDSLGSSTGVPLNLSIRAPLGEKALVSPSDEQTLDLSIKKAPELEAVDEAGAVDGDPVQNEPMDFSKKTLDSQAIGGEGDGELVIETIAQETSVPVAVPGEMSVDAGSGMSSRASSPARSEVNSLTSSRGAIFAAALDQTRCV